MQKHQQTWLAESRRIQACEVVGWQDVSLMQQLFLRNTLERLVLRNRGGSTDESLAVLIEGENSEIEQ